MKSVRHCLVWPRSCPRRCLESRSKFNEGRTAVNKQHPEQRKVLSMGQHLASKGPTHEPLLIIKYNPPVRRLLNTSKGVFGICNQWASQIGLCSLVTFMTR